MSTTLTPHLRVSEPTAESLAREYDAVDAELERAGDERTLIAAVASWDALRRSLSTWASLVGLRFSQDTRDPEANAARERADALSPQITAREVAIKNRLLAHPQRAALEARFGAQAFRLWESDASAYAPVLDADMIRESELTAEYSQLLAGISVEFDGRRMTLGEVRGYLNSLDRNVRHDATRVRWEALGARAADLDRIFDELVRVRDRMGKALGHANFIPLGYARMQRVGYDAALVARWRESVVRDVVPLARAILERSAKVRGYEHAMSWDETTLIDQPTDPIVDGAGLLRELPAMLGELDPKLGTFGSFMCDNAYIDMLAREGKGPGGFCTSFPTEGFPYIFGTFSGTKDDVALLVHEMGHAFQFEQSKSLPLEDYLSPTLEAAEINSMGLEFLAWPALERFFGDRADLVRADHLAGALLFLPYGCAVDHFQHLVYEKPDATPDERRAMWQEMERLYLPWRSFGDVDYPAAGNYWQNQLHIYRRPFYYIDYTLAQCCALQFWAQSRRDRKGTIERYIGLCARGGSGSFRELVESAGLASPFDGTALRDVVAEARAYLGERGFV